MADPWIPERVVDAAQAAALIRAQFPDVPAERVEELGVGWDNTAYLVDGSWVFRFPRRTLSVGLLEAEGRLLPAVAPRLSLSIPVPCWLGQPTEEYPWPFAGYRLLSGTTACRARLNEAQRTRLAEPLAAFLRRLHGTDVEAMRRLGARGDELNRLDPTFRGEQTEQRLERLAAAGERVDSAAVQRIFAETPRDVTPPVPCLVHGDLYARHLLVDDAAELSGVIDWGDMHLGHPALDLAAAVAVLPPRAHRAFRDAYGPVDAMTWRLARFRALFSSVAIFDYGLQIGDAALADEGRVGVAHVLGADG